MIDLHSHSTFSDGSLTPAELARRAHDGGLTALALTDHDTTDGIPEFLNACGEYGLVGVPGVEISVDVPKGTMHLLGYFIDCKNSSLETVLKRIRSGRVERNDEIVAKLRGLGFNITIDDVKTFASEDVVGRPHFAMAMVKKGYVASKEAAFNLYLGKGKPAYAERYRMSELDSMGAILDAGGVPVLAHPSTMDLGRKDLKKCVEELAGKGLKGIEVYYSEHNVDQVEEYEALAKEFGLVATGGSDFHGQLNPKIELGRGFGNLKIDDCILEELRKKRRKAEG